MLKLRKITLEEVSIAMDIINMAKKHLKEQGIDQWQSGYPDLECLNQDAIDEKGFFVVDENEILAYLCIDFDGEPAYDTLQGTWGTDESYVVVHRMAFSENARGKKLSGKVFSLVEELSKQYGIASFRVDTDNGNKKMQHILKKHGFFYRGIIWFDNSEKIAFDKKID